MPKPIPTISKERFIYNPDTGILTWADGKRKGLAAGNKSGRGHLQVSLFHRDIYLVHRIIWFVYYGEDPGDNVIDHINGDPTDNRISNLRLCSDLENSSNTKKAKGCYRYGNKWVARVMKDRVLHHVGAFKTEEEARAAYVAKKQELCGEFSPV